jgi:hypothetical protein
VTPETDGIDHINVYSKGRTLLGRLLTNFARIPFEHPRYGRFESVEGFWYWLGSRNDTLRTLYGWEAKKVGQESGAHDYIYLPEDQFQNEIKYAIALKISQNSALKEMLRKSTLPLAHYYVYQNRMVQKKQFDWIHEFIEECRTALKGG